MIPEIGISSIIDAILQALRFKLASAASQIDCQNLPWSQIIIKLVEIKRRLPKNLVWKNTAHSSAIMAQFHEACANKRRLDPNQTNKSES